MTDEKKHGGGPKTEEGKARSSENSTTHGMRSKHFRVLEDESPADFRRLQQGWLDEFSPQTFLEEQLVEQLILNSWLMKRADRRYLEAEGAVAGEGEQVYAADWTAAQEHKLELMQRYKTTAERAFYRSLAAAQRVRKDNLNYEFVLRKMSREAMEQDAAMAKLKEENEAYRMKEEEKPQPAAVTPQACVKTVGGTRSKKKEKLQILDQWAEIRVNESGETETKLFPGNDRLKEIAGKMEREPDLVYRRMFFPGEVPSEYAWTTSNERKRGAGGLGTQRMTWGQWGEQIVRESVTAKGHLLPCGGNVPRPGERGGCECEVCKRNHWMLQAVGLG